MDWRDQTDENRLRPDLETLYSQISFVIWRPHVTAPFVQAALVEDGKCPVSQRPGGLWLLNNARNCRVCRSTKVFSVRYYFVDQSVSRESGPG